MTGPNSPSSSGPPSSPGASTVDDPDMPYSSDDRSHNLDASSPNALGSPAQLTENDSPSRSGEKSQPKMLRKGKAGPPKGSYAWIQEGPEDVKEEDEVESVVEAYSKRPGWRQKRSLSPSTRMSTAATTVGTRRKGDGTIGSVYSGNKIRHLKKDDGVPLWRSDIQYEFLRLVFEDAQPNFTRHSDGKEGCNFADIYIDAMARSSKTSKVLKDKLMNDRIAAQNMAMICLLVNVGRMNTTLNFFPEMRAQLRTYHSIPSLQAHRDQSAYKQLQDAPRLKSILKGASEDTAEPRTIEAIKENTVPRTNPVNLIFVLSQYAPKISETHFYPQRDFFDLVMRATISSKSRAQAFLWLMWWYLESDFSEEAALSNPFGRGQRGPKDTMSVKTPDLVDLTEEEGAAENIDPPDEIAFGEEKRIERKRILENDDPENKTFKRMKKGALDEPVSDYETRSLPRASSPAMRDSLGFAVLNPAHNADPALSRLGGQADSLDDDWEHVNPHPGRGRYKRVKKEKDNSGPQTSSSGRVLLKSAKAQADPGTPDSSAQVAGSSHPVLNHYTGDTPTALNTAGSRRPRPLTQHQLAIEAHRRQMTETLLARKKKEIFSELRERRESGDFVLRAAQRISKLPMGYDSEDESTSWGMGGLGPNPNDHAEEDDFGEEAEMWIGVVAKVKRRLERWSGERAVGGKEGIRGRGEKPKQPDTETRIVDDEVEEVDGDGDVEMENGMEEGDVPGPNTALDDIDKSLLAERSDEEMDDSDESSAGDY